MRESLRFALRTPVAALSSMAPKFPPSTTCSLRPQRCFLVCGNLSSFTAPSHWCRPRPYSFVSVISFFFCPTQVCGEFLAFWDVCASLFGSTVSADFLHTDKTVDVSSPRITYFFLFLLSTCSSPKSSLKDPREAFRLAQFGSHGHTLVSVAQRVRG